MRKYLARIVSIIVIVIVFGVAFFIDAPRDVAKYTNSLLADNKMAGDCYEGSGSTRYLVGGYNVRKGPGVGYTSLGVYQRCTMVKVYCTDNGWSKVSKTSEMWISNGGLSKNVPSGCSNTPTTTTKTITFTMGNPTYKYAAGMDQMYSNKAGTISFKLEDVTNLANDDDDLITVNVTKDGNNKNSSFTITKSYSDGTATIKLV